jgi:hypothetical protein
VANLLQSVALFTKEGGPPYARVSSPCLVLAKTALRDGIGGLLCDTSRRPSLSPLPPARGSAARSS